MTSDDVAAHADLIDSAAVVDGSTYEIVRFPADEVLLRVTELGAVQVAEYASADREGPPPHTHPWSEIEYVIEGTVEFHVDGGWVSAGPGSVQMLPAGAPHSVRVPAGRARLLMVTIGAPYDGFARALAAAWAAPDVSSDAIVAVAERHGVHLA